MLSREELEERVARLEARVAQSDRFRDLQSAAENAGDTWFGKAGPHCWEDVVPEISKTVIVVIPNRSHNKQLIPPPLWKYWVNKTIHVLDGLFGGSTIYAAALGSYWETQAKLQHIDEPYIVESVASVEKLSEPTTIDELVGLCHTMMISMDQASIMLVIGSIQVFFNHPWRSVAHANTAPKLVVDKNQALFEHSSPPIDEISYIFGKENYGTYFCTWAKARIEQFVKDTTGTIDNMRSYADDYYRIACTLKQVTDNEQFATAFSSLEQAKQELELDKKYTGKKNNCATKYLNSCPSGCNAADKLALDLLKRIAQPAKE